MMTLSNSSSLSTLKFDDVVSIILSEKVTRKFFGNLSVNGSVSNME